MQRSLTDRMIGAARLDPATYEEVEHDESATPQAAMVVAIYAVASAIGMIRLGGPGVIAGLFGALLGWGIWSLVTYLIGTRVFKGTATWGELLRTIGFAMAPGVLLILGIIPVIGGLVRVIVSIWLLIAVVIAIRQALDISTGKAVGTALLGWLALLIVFSLLGTSFWL